MSRELKVSKLGVAVVAFMLAAFLGFVIFIGVQSKKNPPRQFAWYANANDAKIAENIRVIVPELNHPNPAVQRRLDRLTLAEPVSPDQIHVLIRPIHHDPRGATHFEVLNSPSQVGGHIDVILYMSLLGAYIKWAVIQVDEQQVDQLISDHLLLLIMQAVYYGELTTSLKDVFDPVSLEIESRAWAKAFEQVVIPLQREGRPVIVPNTPLAELFAQYRSINSDTTNPAWGSTVRRLIHNHVPTPPPTPTSTPVLSPPPPNR